MTDDLDAVVVQAEHVGGTPSPKVLQGLRTVTNPNATAAQIRTTGKEIFCAPRNEPRPWYLGWYRSAASRSWPASLGVDFSEFEAAGRAPMLTCGQV